MHVDKFSSKSSEGGRGSGGISDPKKITQSNEYKNIDTNTHTNMTLCELSRSVRDILTPYRFNFLDWGWTVQKDEKVDLFLSVPRWRSKYPF